MDSSNTSLDRAISNKGCLVSFYYYHVLSKFLLFFNANNVRRRVLRASDLGLHCLSITFGDPRLNLVKATN